MERIIFIGIFMTIFFSYFGTIIALLIAAGLILMKYTKHNHKNLLGRFHTPEKKRAYDYYKFLNIDNFSEIVSYKDTIKFGSKEEKIRLIGLLVFKPNKENVNIIKIALNDEIEIVRILSSNTLQKMESIFEEKIKIEIKEENWKSVSLLYKGYIKSGLIDKQIEFSYVLKFIKYINLYLNDNFSHKMNILKFKIIIEYKYDLNIEKDILKFINTTEIHDYLVLLMLLKYRKKEKKEMLRYLSRIDIKKIKNKELIENYSFLKTEFEKELIL